MGIKDLLMDVSCIEVLHIYKKNIVYLSKPPMDAIASLQSLRSLNLAGNRMVNLTKKAFGRIPTLSGMSTVLSDWG